MNPPIQRITPADRGHWFFGYYDKLQFDPTDQKVLAQRVDIHDRPPRATDVAEVGYIDLARGNQWTPLGQTTAWCWQQGCMLQWLPPHQPRVIYNTRNEQGFGATLHDVETGRDKKLPKAIYCIDPTGTAALCLDMGRVGRCRPGYGYQVENKPTSDALAPDDYGLWRMDLATGQHDLILRIADLAARDDTPVMRTAHHWFNHVLYNPSGSRFVFLHRWQNAQTRQTRMYTCAADGSAIHRLTDSTAAGNYHASHFWWQDDQTLILWGNHAGRNDGAYLIAKDQTHNITPIASPDLSCDGHMSLRPSDPTAQWMLSDTYPDPANNLRTLFLFDRQNQTRHNLGQFDAGAFSNGDPMRLSLRCDLHPRWDRAGERTTIDSVHEGFRGIYLLDLAHCF